MKKGFTPPTRASKAVGRKMLSITPDTHSKLAGLAEKHEISMTKMIGAIVDFHILNNEK